MLRMLHCTGLQLGAGPFSPLSTSTLIITGGWSRYNNTFTDTILVGTSIATLTLYTLPDTSFSSRAGHVMAVFSNMLVILGGWDGSGMLNDVWLWSNATRTFVQSANAPFTPRCNMTSVTFNNTLYIHGGMTAVGSSSATYSFNGSMW